MFRELGERVDPTRRRARPLGGAAPSAEVEHQGHHVSFSSRLRTTSLGAVLLGLALVASACGGSKADAHGAATPQSSVSASATPTPTPAPTPTAVATPSSPFEGKAPVKATRAYIEAVGRSVNAGDKTLSGVRGLTTPAGLTSSLNVFHSDLAHGYHWPGPEPYTPTALRNAGNSATVSACMLIKGWSVHPATGKTVGRRKVTPVLFEMKKVGGRWKFDAMYSGTGDCGGVKITEVRW